MAGLEIVGFVGREKGKKEHQKLVDKLQYNEDILHKTAHILIKLNAYIKLGNYYIVGMILSMY